MIHSFRDLIVWQKSMDLAEQVHQATKLFPKDELYGLTSQMRRAAVSVPSNITEGQARNSTGEFIQFLGIAQGSLAELETQAELAFRLTLLSAESREQLVSAAQESAKMLHALIAKLRVRR